MGINNSFIVYKRKDLKFIYNLKFEGKGKSSRKRIIAKISKLDKSDQYDYAVTKPMPASCF